MKLALRKEIPFMDCASILVIRQVGWCGLVMAARLAQNGSIVSGRD